MRVWLVFGLSLKKYWKKVCVDGLSVRICAVGPWVVAILSVLIVC